MVFATKTILLPLHATLNLKKQRECKKLMRRITYAVSLFLEISRIQNVFGKKNLEAYRHEVEAKTQLPSGIVQACRDQAVWILKLYPRKLDTWKSKLNKIKKQILKLELRQAKHIHTLKTVSDRATKKKAKSQMILANTIQKLAKKQENLEHLEVNAPKFPSLKRRQVINFDTRIGSFETAKETKSIDYWVNISTFTRGKRLQLPVQGYTWANNYLSDETWLKKSFRVVWNPDLQRFFVHLMLEKEFTFPDLLAFYGSDPGMKRLLYASSDPDLIHPKAEAIKKQISIMGSHPRIRPLLSKLKVLSDRIARLQRLQKIKVLKRLKNKRYGVARQLRYVIASIFVNELPVESVMVALGLPKKLRQNQGQRAKNYPNLKVKASKKHRKRLHRWSYRALTLILEQKLLEAHHLPIIVTEVNTTRRCHKCESLNSEIHDREFTCLNCGYKADRDKNASDNICDNGLSELVCDLVSRHYVPKKIWFQEQKLKKKKKNKTKQAKTKRLQEQEPKLELELDLSKISSEVTAHVTGSRTKNNRTNAVNQREKLPVATNLSVSSARTKGRGITGGRPCEPSLNMRNTSLMPHLSLKKDNQPGNRVIGQVKARKKKDLVPGTREA